MADCGRVGLKEEGTVRQKVLLSGRGRSLPKNMDVTVLVAYGFADCALSEFLEELTTGCVTWLRRTVPGDWRRREWAERSEDWAGAEGREGGS